MMPSLVSSPWNKTYHNFRKMTGRYYYLWTAFPASSSRFCDSPPCSHNSLRTPLTPACYMGASPTLDLVFLQVTNWILFIFDSEWLVYSGARNRCSKKNEWIDEPNQYSLPNIHYYVCAHLAHLPIRGLVRDGAIRDGRHQIRMARHPLWHRAHLVTCDECCCLLRGPSLWQHFN